MHRLGRSDGLVGCKSAPGNARECTGARGSERGESELQSAVASAVDGAA